MVRSMYSGVAGMKAHQTKMDTIGNNISNVNTIGFKSGRVSFRDVYYQTMSTASRGTGTKGGTNPSQVGYGAVIGGISVDKATSTMQNTGNSLDVGISGEGFFQVQDSDGNTFYTKAGMLDIDSYGNLVDINGNFVLGVSGNPVGKPASSNRIQISVPSVTANVASGTLAVNSANIKITASKQTTDGNVTFNFSSGGDLPIGQDVEAIITSSGVNVRVNPKAEFATSAAFSTAVNNAIKAANGGKDHPAGTFNITVDPASKFPTSGGSTSTGVGLTGAQIIGNNFGIDKGSIGVPTAWQSIFSIDKVGDGFTGGTIPAAGSASPQYDIVRTVADPPTTTEDSYKFSITSNGQLYEATLTASQMSAPGSIILKATPVTATNTTDTITMNFPSLTSLHSGLPALNPNPAPGAGTTVTVTENTGTATAAKPSTASKDLGLSGNPIKLEGGTAGGPQTVEDLTGIAIGSDGVIVGSHAIHGLMELGRIDLVTFANPKGLSQAGNTYYTVSANSGDPTAAKPGENGTGALAGGSLEMSNVDLSNEFADMITTQRGFQANSRIITVSDTMLEELINLKR